MFRSVARSLSCLLLAGAAIIFDAQAQLAPSRNGSGEWVPLLPASLSGHSAVYDATRKRMIVFGGDDGAPRNDVWVLALEDAREWSVLSTAGTPPPPRAGHSAIYDPIRDRMIVFGGGGGSRRVWELSFTSVATWNEITPSGTLPTARYGHSAIYDPVRNRMVIFGGYNSGPGSGSDVWALALSGNPVWTDLTPETSPSARGAHSAIYDPIRDRMLVFGGSSNTDSEVWALTLAGTPTWSVLAISGEPPTGRRGHCSIYDPLRDRMIVFAGDADGSRNDTWALTLSGAPTWSPVIRPGVQPAVRAGHSAIHDPLHDEMIVYGGTIGAIIRNDVWALPLEGKSSWHEFAPFGTLPEERTGHSAIYDSAGDRMIVFGGGNGITTYRNDVWALTLIGDPLWSSIVPAGGAPPGLVGHKSIYDPIANRMIVYGGSAADYGYPYGVVWELTLSGSPVWNQLTPLGTGPAARVGHTAIYDPLRHRMIVFGGWQGGPRNDVWALTLSGTPSWVQLFPAGTWPRGRAGHSAIYDATGDRMVVFGGSADSDVDEVWALSLAGATAWTQLQPPGSSPGPRSGHHAIYDAIRGRMVVFGRGGYANGLTDVWALSLSDGRAWVELNPGGTQPPRLDGQSVIYDPENDRMVVFGGRFNSHRSDVWMLNWDFEVTAVGLPPLEPGARILGARPNPITSSAQLHYELAREQHVRIDVLDLQGRRIRRLRDGPHRSGSHSVMFNRRDDEGRRLQAGVYFLRLEAGTETHRSRVVVLP